MAKLETQINQIFLTHPESKLATQILYEEMITAHCHVFILAEIEKLDAKKICDIILSTFRKNKKLPPETLFESSLAEINENLADLAHKGRKTWLNKFSACIALKNGDNLYLGSSGRAMALLKRKSELSEILSVEKKDPRPLKTFQNFTIGKVKDADSLIITLNNLFNYISLPLFARSMNESDVEGAVQRFTQILKDSAGNESFACFILQFQKPIPQTSSSPAAQPESMEEIYAPLPEMETTQAYDTHRESRLAPTWRSLKKIAQPLSLLAMVPENFSIPKPKNWSRLSRARKFFLVSSFVFVFLFGINIVVFGLRLSSKKHHQKVEAQIAGLTTFLHEAESALIYKNDEQAFQNLNSAWAEYEKLKTSEPTQAVEIEPIIRDLSDKINRISKIEQPQAVAELKFVPSYLVKAGNGFLIAGKDSKSLTLLTASGNSQNVFLINNPADELRGIQHVPGVGHMFITASKLYLVNESAKQAELVKNLNGRDSLGLKLGPSSRIYTADKSSNQILRLAATGGSVSDPAAVIPFNAQLIDFGLDKDVYLLYPDSIKKFVNGAEQFFKTTTISDPLANANKILVASNLYVLEATKKRLLIFNKQGGILSQIIFPNAGQLSDFYVDEQQRSIYLLDGNKLLRITF